MNRDQAGMLFLLLIIAIVAGVAVLKSKEKPKTITHTIVKREVVYKQVNNINKQALVGWIYKNSFRCSKMQANKYAKIILKEDYPLLIASIIKQESSYNSTATNKVGKTLVIGLMQIYLTNNHITQLKKAGIIKNVRDLYNPATNVKAGVFILKDIIRIQKGDLQKSLKMYCGNSINYSRRVLENLGQLSLEVK